MLIKMIRRLTSAVVVLLFVFAFFHPADGQAATSPTNASVFTGRFIPAFIGGAYDPTPAYSEMAGLPVYVFAFDFWRGLNQTGGFVTNDWIISDLAVRTQVRADGSFQVQGLPTADFYGVYFPFVLNGGKVSRVDCTNGNSQSVDFYDPAVATNPCKGQERNYPFRMPGDADRLLDSFSYAAYNLSPTEVKVVDSQVRSDPGNPGSPLEKVAIQSAFVTNRVELNIENNINTFPVVPNTVIRAQFRITGDSGSTNFEVQAVRLSHTYPGQQNIIGGVINFPTISGRMALTGQEVLPAGTIRYTHTFQGFAPEGYYAIVVWRKEASSPAYNVWNGRSDLNTHSSGWAQAWVTDTDDYASSSDWRRALEWSDLIPLADNAVIVWGTVTDQNGSLLTTKSGISGVDSYVQYTSDFEYPYVGIPASVGSDARFVVTSNPNFPNKAQAPFFAPRGIYAFMLDISVYGVTSQPLGDRLSVSLDDTRPGLKDRYTQAVTDVGFVHSSSGPRRVDIVTNESTYFGQIGGTQPDSRGYDQGILVRAKRPGTSGDVPVSGARVTLALLDKDNNALGETKTYNLNRLGELLIPAVDLKPLPPASVASYTDLVFALMIEQGSFYSYQLVSSNPNLPGGAVAFDHGMQDPAYPTDPGRKLLAVVDTALTEFTDAGHLNNNYNLAILNTLSNKFSIGTMAAAGDPTITINVYVPDGAVVNGDLNVTVTQPGAAGRNISCIAPQCRVLDLDTGNVVTKVPTSGNIKVELGAPAQGWWKENACKATFTATALGPLGIIIGGVANKLCEAVSGKITQVDTYDVVIEGEIDGQRVRGTQRVSVDSAKRPQPPSATVILGQDCVVLGQNIEAQGSFNIGPVQIPSWMASINGFIAQSGCSMGNFFVSKITSALGIIYSYGLETRALTQDQPVIYLYDAIRNLVNVAFVLIFIIITVMTVLKYQPEQWHISVLLPKLLMALILANFSLLIVQGLLDLNNFATNTLFQVTSDIINSSFNSAGNRFAVGGVGVSAGIVVIAGFGAAAVNMAIGLTTLIVGTGGSALVAIVAFAVSVMVVFFMQVVRLLLIFFLRYAVLWLAVVVAPAAMVLDVLPWFNGIRMKWLSLVIGVTTIQTAVAGVLSIGVLLLTLTGTVSDSLFTMFGTFAVGIAMLYLATKLPEQMLSIAKMIPQIGDFSGFKETSAKRGEQLVEDRAAWEKNYELETGKKPGALRKGLKGVRQGYGGLFRAGSAAVTGGASLRNEQARITREAAVESQQKAGAAFAVESFAKRISDENTKSGVGVKVSKSDVSQLNTMHTGAPPNRRLLDINNKRVTVGQVAPTGNAALDAAPAELRHILMDSLGRKKSFEQFVRDVSRIKDPAVRAGLLRDARKEFGWTKP